jgi:hypothetical protein
MVRNYKTLRKIHGRGIVSRSFQGRIKTLAFKSLVFTKYYIYLLMSYWGTVDPSALYKFN